MRRCHFALLVAVVAAASLVGMLGGVSLASSRSGVTAPVTTLAPAAADGAARLGQAVAISGDTALVSALATSYGGGSGWGLYVFVRSAGVWSAQDVLRPWGGHEVAIDGDTVVVGLDGSAAVFVRSGSSWVKQAELTPGAEGGWDDEFGSKVAVDGDTAVVGAPYWGPDPFSDYGTVYVYRRSGTTWRLEARLVAADGGPYDRFGDEVAVDVDTILVGAPERDLQRGAVYVYSMTGSGLTPSAELALPGAAPQDSFGAALALSEGTALIGAPGQTVDGKDCGAAYIFVRGAAGWARQACLIAGDPEVGDGFGASLSLDGDLAVVGAADHNVSHTVLGAGAGYAYWRTGNSWSLPVWLTAPDAQDGDRLFEDVAVADGFAVTSASWRFDVAPDSSDHAYAFALVRPLAPRLAGLSRTSARRATAITITGRRFGAARGFSYVKFGAKRVTRFKSWSAGSITCKVPATARLGRIKVRVVTPGGTSLARLLTVKR